MSVIYGRPKGLNANQSIYCPGCTHGLEHKLVMEVLEELGVLDRTIGVTSVGCSGLMYRILNTEVVTSLHGRAPAVATGIKAVQPDSIVYIHQGDGEATELWLHFQKVINWIETLFTKYRREMKGLEWGRLYSEYSARSYNPKELEARVSELMADKEVQNKKGVYEYLLSDGARKEKLNLRQFDDEEKRAAYEAQKGVCPVCGGHFEYEEMEGDHIVPWSKGGKTVPENLQMLCRRDNALKGDR